DIDQVKGIDTVLVVSILFRVHHIALTDRHSREGKDTRLVCMDRQQCRTCQSDFYIKYVVRYFSTYIPHDGTCQDAIFRTESKVVCHEYISRTEVLITVNIRGVDGHRYLLTNMFAGQYKCYIIDIR